MHSTVEIGPYSVIGKNVTIEENTIIGPHVVIKGDTVIGKNNRFFQFSSILQLGRHLPYLNYAILS